MLGKKIKLFSVLFILLIVFSACAPKSVIVIPEDRMIEKLSDGYYKVSPAWLQERYQYERKLLEDLKKCRGK